MINVNELRIGNKLFHIYDDWPEETVVEGIEYDKVHIQTSTGGGTTVNISEVEPIPLTPEWLEKFGFTKDMGGGGGLLEFENGFICFYDMEAPLVAYTNERIKGAPMPHLKYVHQLQNLYFSLTGEELTIKEKV